MLSYRAAVDGRVKSAAVSGAAKPVDAAIDAAKDLLKGITAKADRVAVVLSAQHSLEDNWALYTLGKTFLGVDRFFVTGKPLGRGDDILMSADKNPNTAGVMKLCDATPPRPLQDLLQNEQQYDFVIALGGHVEVEPSDLKTALRGKKVLTIATHLGPLTEASKVVLPAAAWAEVDSTWVNKQGRVQTSERALVATGDAEPGWLLVAKVGKALGLATNWRKLSEVRRAMMGAPPAEPEKKSEVRA
jgi:NADH-quinone oxidoreductase subunit G